MADYDAGEVTDREELAAERQKEIAGRHASGIKNQLNRQLANYDFANEQNARLRDVQLGQARQKGETDRFEAQRQLQNAATGLFGSMNQAMNSSTIGNTLSMLRNRNDSDNTTYWQQLQDNINAVRNAYEESANQNQVAKMDAIANAEKAIRDVEDDLSANLANINPNLYVPGGTGDARFNATELYNDNKVPMNMAQRSGYLMPENAEQNILNRRNTLNSNGYFNRLINGFNNR